MQKSCYMHKKNINFTGRKKNRYFIRLVLKIVFHGFLGFIWASICLFLEGSKAYPLAKKQAKETERRQKDMDERRLKNNAKT